MLLNELQDFSNHIAGILQKLDEYSKESMRNILLAMFMELELIIKKEKENANTSKALAE
jgi:hypothetical protein